MRFFPACALALLLSAPPVLAAETVIAIPAGPLPGALSELSRLAGISIGGDLPLARRHSPGTAGTLSPEQALSNLLAGTGLGFQRVGPGAYRLESLAVPRPHPVNDRAGAEMIDPIIVTATKRGAYPADLPVSVGVLTGTDLSRFGAVSMDATVPLLGAVSSTHLGPGRNKLSIRGLSDSAFTGQTQATVGLYLDNAKVNYNAPDPHLRLIDLDRVEVLRGPQGTLYGGGSIGGILRIVPAAPDLSERTVQARVSGSLTRGGAPGGGVEAVLNQPLLTDRLGLRLSLYADREGGVIDTDAGRRNIDRTDMQGGRALLAFVPADDWRLELGGTYQLIDTDDSHYLQGRRGCCTRAEQLAEPHDNDFNEAHATLTGSLPFASLHSTTAFVRHEIGTVYDASRAVPGLAGGPVQPARFQERQLSRLWTHETRLSSIEGGEPPVLDWIAGLYLSRQQAQGDRTLSAVTAPQVPLWRRDRTDSVKEAALFGEVAWRFLPDWTLTAGGRLFHVKQEVTATAVAPVAADAEGYARETDYTPKLALTWKAWEGASLYAQMAEGYRPGGLNIEEGATGSGDDYRTARFRTDELWNYELGAKLAFWEDRLFVDAALFHARWRNIQTDQLRATGLIYTTNAGDGTNTGLEIGSRLHLGGWRLEATMTLNDPELTQVAPGFAASPEGGLPGAARLSGALALSWRGSIADDIAMVAALDLSRTGRTRLTFTDAIRQGPVTLLNGRVGFDLAGGWTVGLSMENMLDTQANQFAFGNPFTLSAGPQTTPPRPRTVGLHIAWSQ